MDRHHAKAIFRSTIILLGNYDIGMLKDEQNFPLSTT